MPWMAPPILHAAMHARLPIWVKGGCADPVTDQSGVTPTPEVHGRGLPLGLRANNGHWP